MNDYGRKSNVAQVQEILFLEYLGLFIKDDDEVDLNVNGGGWGEPFFFFFFFFFSKFKALFDRIVKQLIFSF